MKTALFDYDLPLSFIAQNPLVPRDSSRLLVLNRATGAIQHRRFRDIVEYLEGGDLLVANNSRVIPARLHAHKPTGGKVEILLLNRLEFSQEREQFFSDGMHTEEEDEIWECLVRGRNINPGVNLTVDTEKSQKPVTGHVDSVDESGSRVIRFSQPISPLLTEVGELPLPPYITAFSGNPEQYQTVYSHQEGSVAAPTAGLHFTPELLIKLRQAGVHFDTVTLHVGLDTFRPVESNDIEGHRIHSEIATLTSEVARRINDTTLQGGRIVAVGTTSVRTLEWAATSAQGIDPYENIACPWQRTAAFSEPVDLYIRPGYRFRAVDSLLTNFHLPRSSLLMLVSAFVGQTREDIDEGRRILLSAYEEAKEHGYRFFSFGDAMLIL